MAGKTRRFDRGWLKVRFTFNSPSQGSFVVEEGGVIPNGHAETVALDLKEMRDDVHLNSWTEASGATVTHVENFANATVYSKYVTSQNERTTAMNDQNQQEVTIRDNPDKGRFDVLVEDTHAGFSMYKDFGEMQRIFYHTVVFDEFEGRGLAGTLTRTALSTSAQAGYRIVAVCPYVKKWLSTHHDFDEVTDPVGREHLRALR
ncbi:GNAT family N-acetyltransferase [Streptosporangium sp. G11]|uniref:GNAT family N-acetyltransferase n=1 Tax=Streptosporangium sp. G11 TaxID=3436926 RepID=UPI003EC06055